MPQRIIRDCIVEGVKPFELVSKLVHEAGGALPVAKAMRRPSFQGTLHKFCAGKVHSPSRATAERIARHFGIDVDAIYSESAANVEAARLWPADGLHRAEEPAAAYEASAWPLDPWISRREWGALSEQMRGVAGMAAAQAVREARALLTPGQKRQASGRE